jgi:hypothetical protein
MIILEKTFKYQTNQRPYVTRSAYFEPEGVIVIIMK